MRLKIDKENDALYFRLDEASIVESEEVETGVVWIMMQTAKSLVLKS